MKDQEREELVASLAMYIAAMGPHQRERRGGQLILRCFDVLKKIRVLPKTTKRRQPRVLNCDYTKEQYRGTRVFEVSFPWGIETVWIGHLNPDNPIRGWKFKSITVDCLVFVK